MNQRNLYHQATLVSVLMLALSQMPSNASDSWVLTPGTANLANGFESQEVQEIRDSTEWEIAVRQLQSRAVPIRWS